MSLRPIARIDLAALRRNFSLLSSLAGAARVCAVVKADAYGHGLRLVAPALAAAGCDSFAVTDANEAALLRELIGAKPDILLLAGVHDGEDAKACAECDLKPVLHDPSQIERLAQAGFSGAAWIKAETGMHRLAADNLAGMAGAMAQNNIRLAGLLSHLACADEPEHPMNREQLTRLTQARRELAQAGLCAPDAPLSLAASGGLLHLPEARLDLVRPGLALYGCDPAGRNRELQPVMQFEAPVLQVHALAAGESVSYGATFTAREPMRIAVLRAGYADGAPRALSNRGHVLLHGRRLPVIGRVCMDYAIIALEDVEARTGDLARFWGAGIPAEQAAQATNTIPYTLFTGVGARVPRIRANAIA